MAVYLSFGKSILRMALPMAAMVVVEAASISKRYGVKQVCTSSLDAAQYEQDEERMAREKAKGVQEDKMCWCRYQWGLS